MAPVVYLISGAGRGIGLALVAQLSSCENAIVFAGARNPAAAEALQLLENQHPGKVYLVKLTSADESDNEAAVAKIKETAGRLDVVIANAGHSDNYVPAAEVPIEGMRKHFEVNALGPLVLFQSTWPLLKASTDHPKFFTITSELGGIPYGPSIPWPAIAYGVSKAAANWITAKLYFENPRLIAFPIHPGVVNTDMAIAAAKIEPLFAAVPKITPEESAKGIVKVVEAATRREDGPKFLTWDGGVMPW
ncbi:NAD(P)-binding protein [Calocera cornea HHB12733]|uniref:NAD(P)-binding protein n=1 Tax=Calocera cornea HHB12733 TaxID=1353952 RepID=A0A165E939_9BASI|nr:NAD(P)-binding protein [Calocera cornea HHB12733]